MKRVAFVTTFCPHHREETFRLLSKYHDLEYFFFSAGGEWYWQREHGVRSGDFRHHYLWGVNVGRTRVSPSLPVGLWRGRYDVFVKCINGRFALPVTYLIARLRRRPFVLWTGIWMRLRTPAHQLAFPLTRYIYRHADAIVTYGDHVRDYLVSEGVDEAKIFVAHHAVDNAQYSRVVPDAELRALRESLGIDHDKKVVLFLGRLAPEKGLEYLVEAFAALKRDDTVLVLAGTGTEREGIERAARLAGVAESVIITGHVKAESAITYYALATVCVLPSVTLPAVKELWGLVVNEAMNQGVPVIASDAVGAAAGGLVRNNVNGFIVPERDAASLTERMKQVLDDAQLRARLSDAARAAIREWDNERMVRGFRDAIEYVTAT
jgi:glycosyltransferase involved in cell wall biosynthesis